MPENLDILCRLLEQARPLGADCADAIMFETSEVNATRRMRKPEGLERSESRAIGLRVFCGQQQALVSTTDTTEASLKELAARAVAMARATPPDPDSMLAPAALHPKSIIDLDIADEQEPSPEWLDEQCMLAEEAALSVKGITNSEGADAGYSKGRVSLATANGKITFAESYKSSHFSLSVSVVAGAGTDMQRDYDFSSKRYRADLESPVTIGQKAAARALMRLHPKKAQTCQVPVIFDPRVSRSIPGILAGAISGSAITRGSSFLKNAMGEMIFPKSISIVDDPHIKRGLASKPFDAEGVANRKLALVEDGVLKSWLLDMRTANRLKLQTTGHAARGIASPPSPAATNLYLAAGTLTPKELMADIKQGLYVVETFGMGINTVTGDYSQGASGFWIEDGVITFPVSEITIAGRLQDMFRELTPANDLEFRYATNAPTLRVTNMTVAGL